MQIANHRSFELMFRFPVPKFMRSLAEVGEIDTRPRSLRLTAPHVVRGVVDIARRGALGLEGGNLFSFKMHLELRFAALRWLHLAFT
jgi:hypothetical protein